MAAVLTQEDGVPSLHLFARLASTPAHPSGLFGGPRALPAGLAHLLVMDADTRDANAADRSQLSLIEQVLSLSELCAHLHVSAQTIYDLRSQGRGPRGFRVGRELRFRVSEVEAWLQRMENDDDRHHVGRGL
jgi:excisionase family DNA binding protein